jgi:NTP pyrophosphatase (non-canonical NTP hydrolase)
MQDDRSTTVSELREIVQRFVDERDWQQFHAPKNLSMSLAIEAAELMEHFQWISVESSRSIGTDPDQFMGVQEELADVLCYVLALANELDIDLAQALQRKMVLNAKKYPIDEIKGRFGHEDKGPTLELVNPF